VKKAGLWRVIDDFYAELDHVLSLSRVVREPEDFYYTSASAREAVKMEIDGLPSLLRTYREEISYLLLEMETESNEIAAKLMQILTGIEHAESLFCETQDPMELYFCLQELQFSLLSLFQS